MLQSNASGGAPEELRNSSMMPALEAPPRGTLGVRAASLSAGRPLGMRR